MMKSIVNPATRVSNDRLQQLIAEARAKAAAASLNEVNIAEAASAASIESATPEIITTASITTNKHQINGFAGTKCWNTEQQQAIDMIAAGKSVVIVGSAGTGKTTLVKEGLRLRSMDAKMPLFTSSDSTDCLAAGSAGIVVCSFTKTAVNNIAKAIENAANTATIHKLIEFKPVIYTEWSEEKEAMVNKRIFEPARNNSNPLPANLKTIIIEEAGIVNIRLFNQLIDALPDFRNVQFIFLGDLFQLDPPYDPAILGYAMKSLPVVELTKVYRQALESPILKLAIDLKEGKTWGSQHLAELNTTGDHGNLTVKPWKHKIDSFKATIEAAKFIKKEWQAGRYNPQSTSIIIPFGATLNSKDKEAAFGSFNLNKHIANFLGAARSAVVHEVIAGFSKHYLAEGDDISYQKVRGTITKITKNAKYLGKQSSQPASINLDRWGYNHGGKTDIDEFHENSKTSAEMLDEIDRLLLAASASNDEALRSSSHIIDIELEDGTQITLEGSGDFNPQTFDFSYAQTCYKAQGGEWENVYVFTHKSHAVSLCNEFFYTAVTRAKKNLTLVVEPDHLLIAAKRQSIAGFNWKEKLAHFNQPRKLESIKPFTELCTWLAWQEQQLTLTSSVE